jgi:hypothetical protein
VVYGCEPPSTPPYQLGTAQTETVDTMLADRDNFLIELRTMLKLRTMPADTMMLTTMTLSSKRVTRFGYACCTAPYHSLTYFRTTHKTHVHSRCSNV